MSNLHWRCANGTVMPMTYLESMARHAHEMSRHVCGMIGDDALSWDDAPQWQRDSALKGVQEFLDCPMITPRESHDKWAEHKFSQGWRYGIKKSERTKEHPCLKQYDLLSVEQRVKDYVFLASCHLLYEKWLLEIHPALVEAQRLAEKEDAT